MSQPTITLAMLAELVESARIVYIRSKPTHAEMERLGLALAPLQWRVGVIQDSIPVEIKVEA